jgi:hypothetical protein
MVKFNGYVIYKDKQIASTGVVPSNYVNAVSNQKINSVYIPANTFSAGDILHIEWDFKLTGSTAGNATLFLYWNETNDLTTPIQLMSRTIANTNINIPQNRRLSVVTSNGSGTGSVMYNTSVNLDSDFAVTTSVISSGIALNWTIDSYIILAGYSGTGTGVRSQFLKITN